MLNKEKFLEMLKLGDIILTSTFTGQTYTVRKFKDYEPYFVVMLVGSRENREYKTDEIIQSINDQFFKFQYVKTCFGK